MYVSRIPVRSQISDTGYVRVVSGVRGLCMALLISDNVCFGLWTRGRTAAKAGDYISAAW